MGTDLHTAIREALRAGEITAADLRYPVLREPPERRKLRFLAVAGAAAVIITLAVVLSLAGSGDNGGRGVAGTGSLTGVVGYRWQVTQIVDSQGTLAVPPQVDAEIGFTSDGYVLGDDTVNPLQARYQPTAHGYDVQSVIVGGVGSTTRDPALQRMISAVDAMFFSTASEPIGIREDVDVTLHGEALTLSSRGVVLTLTRLGPQPDFGRATVSPTPTAAQGFGSVSGRFLAVGGPYGVPSPRPIRGSGTVQFTNTASGDVRAVITSRDGSYRTTLAPGTYTVRGTTPAYINGSSECAGDRLLTVHANQASTANLYCQEK